MRKFDGIVIREAKMGRREIKGRLESLSPRDRDVADLLLEGCSHHEIGVRLGLTIGTVRNYVARLRRKLKIEGDMGEGLRGLGYGVVVR